MDPNRRELVQALVQALRWRGCHFRRGVLTTLSDAPGDKQGPPSACPRPWPRIGYWLVERWGDVLVLDEQISLGVCRCRWQYPPAQFGGSRNERFGKGFEDHVEQA